MLIQFNFKNFKAFKEHSSLDMTAIELKEHQYNLYDNRLLKVAAIYGANASGKTTVLEAFKFMMYFAINSFKDSQENRIIPLKRFAFDNTSKNKPSEFEVFIKYKNTVYQYGFILDSKRVIEEWLYKRNNKTDKYKTIFKRIDREVSCSPEIKEAMNFSSILEENTLFLSICSNGKIPYVKDVMQWFLDVDSINNNHYTMDRGTTSLINDKLSNREYQKELVKFFNAIDINIEDIEVEKIKTENEEERYRIFAYHKIKDSDEMILIPFYEESSGTQKMFVLYNVIQSALELGVPIFIDGLDKDLHPLLIRYIISMFHSEKINENSSQLIYTTNDSYTLNNEIFRRDEIWFVDKDINSASSLYSLVEYKISAEHNYSKDYLSGKFGAIPILNSFIN